MIHTLTVNPALDITYRIAKLQLDDSARASAVYRAPGGKGINVSRVAARLSHPTVAMGFMGGRAGDEIMEMLHAEGVRTWFSELETDTRTNVIVQDDSNKQLRITAKGYEVSKEDIHNLIESIFDLRQPDFLVLSGSLAEGMPKDFYAQLIQKASAEGIKTVTDADGEALKAAIKAGCALIKPNQYELSRLVGRELKTLSEAHQAALEALEMGVSVVVASLGAEGAMYVSKDAALFARAPKVKVDSAVGAGDSLLAGVLVALAERHSPEEALRLGVACGSATAMTPGTELCYKETIDALYDEVGLEPL
ncbi:MAG: 1-phosphofructokinase [Deinococcales bacterium]